MSYDASDRMTEARQDYSGTEQHAYNFANRRVWCKFPSSGEYVTFYGAFGEDVGDLKAAAELYGRFVHDTRKIYFGGRAILTEREYQVSAVSPIGLWCIGMRCGTAPRK